MKKLLFALLISNLPAGLFCQSISEKDKLMILEKKEFFLLNDLPLDNYRFDNAALNNELQKSLIFRKKKNTNNIVGGILVGVGAAWLISGISLSSKDDNSVNGIAKDLAGGPLIGLGVVAMGVSIPFFIKAGNRKKDMDKSLAKAKELFK